MSEPCSATVPCTTPFGTARPSWSRGVLWEFLKLPSLRLRWLHTLLLLVPASGTPPAARQHSEPASVIGHGDPNRRSADVAAAGNAGRLLVRRSVQPGIAIADADRVAGRPSRREKFG